MSKTTNSTQAASNQAAQTAKTATEEAQKTAKSVTQSMVNASPFEMSGTPVEFAIPESVRSFAEQAVTRTQEAYERSKDAMEGSTEALETTIDEASNGAVAMNRKMIEFAQKNLNSSFDFAKDFASAGNLSDAFEIQTKFARKQFDTFTSQAEELRTLMQEVVTSTTRPMTDQVSKTTKYFRENA